MPMVAQALEPDLLFYSSFIDLNLPVRNDNS